MYDDSTTNSSDDQYSESVASTCTETYARNASLSALEVYQLEAEGTSYNKLSFKMKLLLQYVQPTQLDTSEAGSF
eukprot:1118509-Ditylum_brightwellii.AAC.2